MKLILAFALAAVAAATSAVTKHPKAPKKNRIAESLISSRHTDEWCHEHHIGAGGGACRKHPGCCFSEVVSKQFKNWSAKNKLNPVAETTANLDSYGPCHSCDHHAHEWCKFYGKLGTTHCIKLSMCTWKVGKTKGTGECRSKIQEHDFAKDIKPQCNKNMGDPDDHDYTEWKQCIRDSKASAGGNKCYITKPLMKNEKEAKMQKTGCLFPDPVKKCNVPYPKVVDRIEGGQLWFKSKLPCKVYKACKKRRKWNRKALDRCPDGYKFRWELPSKKGAKMAAKNKDGTHKRKANNKLGTHEFGCKDLYSYKASCVKDIIKRCKKTKEDGVRKMCVCDSECNPGKAPGRICDTNKECASKDCKDDKCTEIKKKDTCEKTTETGNTKEYEAYQADEDGMGYDGYFCVDKQGHEIPDTRKTRPVELFDINCNTQRKKHAGMQCPNAVTLTTRGGGIVVNKRRGKKPDCDVHCNSDTDCKGDRWCCFNGCGYKCKTPVKPLAGCAQPPGKNQRLVQHSWKIKAKKTMTAHGGGKTAHGIEILAMCAPGYAQIPKIVGKMPRQQMTLKCNHGAWEFCPGQGKPCLKENKFAKLLECKQDCPKFILADTVITTKTDKMVAGKKVGVTVTKATLRKTVQEARSGDNLFDALKPVRARDMLETKRSGFLAKNGDEASLRHFGASRTIACPPGYGAVQHESFLGKGRKGKKNKSAKSLHIVRHGYEVLTCGAKTEGQWEKRHLECSVCYDAYEWQWRDKAGNSCAYYRSRPLKCHDTGMQVYTPKRPGARPRNGICGKWSPEWARYGFSLLEMGQITLTVYRDVFQPWGEVKFAKLHPYKDMKEMADPNWWKASVRKNFGSKGSPRPCECIPELQKAFVADDPKTEKKDEGDLSPPAVCGQMVKGKRVTVDPVTKETFKKGGKDKGGNLFSQGYFVMPKLSFGNAIDNCRVACRSCDQAETKYLQRTRYSKEVFQELLRTTPKLKGNVWKKYGGSAEKTGEPTKFAGKWKLVKRRVLDWVEMVEKHTRTKTHSKSYPIDQVCTDGKGKNFLKCDVLKIDPRPICKVGSALRRSSIDEATKCKKSGGFKPMKE